MTRLEPEPRVLCKAIVTMLIEKKITTGAEFRTFLDAVILHESEESKEDLK